MHSVFPVKSGVTKWYQIWGGEERMTWHGGTHEFGRRIEKLLEKIVF
jgi:hypothetical protein